MTPRPNCETCGGTGTIYAGTRTFSTMPGEIEYEDVYMDCPECEVVNEIENEQVNP